MQETKVWGSVQHVFDGPVQVSLLRVSAGTFCSLHRHKTRWNQFQVVRGKIYVVLYFDDLSVKEKITLRTGERATVPPGVLHRFEVLADGQVVEIYWTADGSAASLDDIERVREGGSF